MGRWVGGWWMTLEELVRKVLGGRADLARNHGQRGVRQSKQASNSITYTHQGVSSSTHTQKPSQNWLGKD